MQVKLHVEYCDRSSERRERDKIDPGRSNKLGACDLRASFPFDKTVVVLNQSTFFFLPRD